nr:uncharacterized protein LOC111428198 isoform X1 [Onthophagus taurus]
MSKNPETSTTPSCSMSKSSSMEHVGQHHHKKSKRKYSKIKLPTPPPDPHQEHEGDYKKSQDVLEYLETLQKINPNAQNLMRVNSIFTPAIATEDAFDHLEKLYKLMEQMILLRDQNAKLYRRVRDLEHLRNLQNMQKYLEENEFNEVDTAFAENLLDTILSDTKRDPKLPKSHHHQNQFRFRQSLLRRQRNRSNSVTLEKNIDMDRLRASYRRSSALSGPDKKISKWTRVKAAFKWEKASQTVSDVKSQDSGIGGMQPVNFEVTRYLRVPSTSEDPGISPCDSGAAEISTPGTISSASSTEDVFCPGRRDPRDDTSDDDQSFTLDYIPNLKDDQSKSPTPGKNLHRTTWARMKDIIQPRNSLKKRKRLSVKSDDSRLEDAMLSDEDVFESKDSKSPLPSPKSLNTPGFEVEHFPFVEVQTHDDQHQIEQTTPKLENLSKIQEEIQNNYRELQTKLSLEFQDKMNEWEKSKQHQHQQQQSCSNSPNNTSATLSLEEQKEQAFKKKMEEWEKIKGQSKHSGIQLQSEEHLPLEFRKKLQEWQKIKKGDTSSVISGSPKKKLGDWPKWKSVSGQRPPELGPLETQHLSEDFMKKLETWKQIKSNSYSNEDDLKENKTPSPKLMRKDGGSGRQSKKIKEQTDKGLQWVEKELTKIEREQQRLERERQKFWEREERLSKLRRSVMGPNNKQNILVQTPCGFYRFEGISRKFTQKLYEWEKAQGIGPEASTFALLSNAYVPTINLSNKHAPPPRLIKCKSADSVMNSELNLTHPLLSQQPSSLSLNDVENLEKECLLNNVSSVPDIRSNHLDETDEPGAVIVEVEDIIEETASPLEFFMDKKQIPVYQHQEKPLMCEGASKIAPKVRRSESNRAQNNYNLIEDAIDLLKLLSENEDDIRFRENQLELESDDPLQIETLKSLYVLQSETSGRLIEKLVRLQEANNKVTSSISSSTTQDGDLSQGHQMNETLDSVQDLSVDVLHLAENLHTDFMNRNAVYDPTDSNKNYPNILLMLKSSNGKILELRRVLSYLCAASDSTAPGRKKKFQRSSKGFLRKLSLKDKKLLKETVDDSDQDLSAQIAQGAIKKRYRYKQRGYSTKTLDGSDDEVIEQKRNNKKNREIDGIKLDLDVIQKVAVPTHTNYVNVESDQNDEKEKGSTTPVQVFVKTTRKLFTPLVTSSFAGENVSPQSVQEKIDESQISSKPPILPSPTTQRKISKEISPNIKLMLARYNQKIHEHESSNLTKSLSSGSSSPIWRSPVTERRVKNQTERYQQELIRLSSPLIKNKGDFVQKSASVSVFNIQRDLQSKDTTKNILKSVSACALSPNDNKPNLLKLNLDTTKSNQIISKDSRSYKLQKAKEDFFNAPLCPMSAPVLQDNPEQEIKYPERNRLSQISVESESSSEVIEGLLIKSASVGMISVDPETYRQINPEIHGGGYVSLPRDTKKRKEGLMSNLASKFRKVKMRRTKDTKGNKMNTISTLCRQSLVVDINPSLGSQETLTAEEAAGQLRKDSLTVPNDSRGSSSGDTSPSTSRSGSWIKKPRLFKPKQ